MSDEMMRVAASAYDALTKRVAELEHEAKSLWQILNDGNVPTRRPDGGERSLYELIQAALEQRDGARRERDEQRARAEKWFRRCGRMMCSLSPEQRDLAAARAACADQAELVQSLRAEAAALRERLERAEATIEEFQDASGLCVPAEERGGDPGNVKPEHVRRYLADLEGRLERAEEVIRTAEAHMTGRGAQGCVCRCPVIDGHTSNCPVVPFLPGAALAQTKEGQ